MSANLSIINEVVNLGGVKEIGNTSGDSGISSSDSTNASSNASSGTSGTGNNLNWIIIPFKALNAGGRKESTFLANAEAKTTCNLSGIEGVESHKITIDSEG